MKKRKKAKIYTYVTVAPLILVGLFYWFNTEEPKVEQPIKRYDENQLVLVQNGSYFIGTTRVLIKKKPLRLSTKASEARV